MFDPKKVIIQNIQKQKGILKIYYQHFSSKIQIAYLGALFKTRKLCGKGIHFFLNKDTN